MCTWRGSARPREFAGWLGGADEDRKDYRYLHGTDEELWREDIEHLG